MLCELGRAISGSAMNERIRAVASRGRAVLSAGKFKHFLADSAGNISMVFMLTLVPTVAFVGMTSDLGRSYMVKQQITSAIDAAVLVGGRTFDNTGDMAATTTAARQYFGKVLPKNIRASISSIKADAKGNVTMTAKTSVPTMFLGIVGINTIGVQSSANSLAADSAGLDLDLAVVMDVTGSMADNQKLATAKTAANALVNILLPAGVTSTRKVRISIVPFSEFVNIGSYASAATGAPSQTTSSRTTTQGCNYGETQTNSTRTCTRYRNDGVTCRTYTTTYTCSTTNYLNSCMAERLQSTTGHAYDDASPSTSPFHAFTTTSSNSTNCTAPAVQITPLTSDPNVLNAAINALSPAGGTAGHIGTAWGWYTISPNWSGFWPTASRPAPIDPTKTMKAMIIMTDGAYNVHYDANYATDYEGYSGDNSVGNGSSRNQANQVCTNIKNSGVEVFSVGVELGNDTASKNFLLGCVSSPDHLFAVHYYDVVSAIASQTGLVAAFNDIGTRLAVATGTGNKRTRLSQ